MINNLINVASMVLKRAHEMTVHSP